MENLIKSYTLDTNEYIIIACSIKGENKVENQDSYCVTCKDNQILVTLADGLGSAPFSKEGADKAVTIFSDELINTNEIYEAFCYSKEKWCRTVSGKKELYDTTLKFVKIQNDKILYGGIGDGWICIDSNERFISSEANNVFTNQTNTILSEPIRQYLNIYEIKNDFKAIIISTDGFSEDIKKEDAGLLLQDVYTKVIENAQAFESEMTESLKNWPIKTNRDDKTVIFVVKKEN